MYTTYATVAKDLGQNSTLILTGLLQADVEAIILRESKFIDDLIQRIETVPFKEGSVPDVIAEICIIFTKHKLWTHKAARDIPDYVQKEYDNAMKLIKSIQKGEISLGTITDYTDDEEDLAEGGITEKMRWISQPRYFEPVNVDPDT